MTYSVLIVDDDAELRILYRKILERHDFNVQEAVNGAEALQYLMNHTPDLIIMDMLMPMLGGETVLQRIQQMPALSNTRIVVLTAYPRFREKAEYRHVAEFLVKPVTPQDILAAVWVALGEPSDPAE